MDKAREYDTRYAAYHSPGLGAAVEVRFGDSSLDRPFRYYGSGDSTIHTGAYLASQAFRYSVTGEPEAKTAALRAARALHHHLRVTGKRGYIARYAGPARLPYLKSLEYCERKPRCHLIDGGTYDGYFWMGDTSRDQYDGWFFGYAVAYDLVDDPELREMIRADVKEVIDFLHSTNWTIVDVNGLPTGAGTVTNLPTFRLAWEAAAAHIIDRPEYKANYELWARGFAPLLAFEYMGVPGHYYFEYYAMAFYHRDVYLIARLDPSPLRQNYYKKAYKTLVRPYVKETDNIFFDYVYMAISGDHDAQVIGRAKEALLLFPDPPNRRICRDPPKSMVDPLSLLLGGIRPFKRRALKPYPIEHQCVTDFLWQRSPFNLTCCNVSDPARVYPGIDYLLAYWMGRYYGFIGEED